MSLAARVVAVELAGGITLATGVGNHRTTAMRANDEPLQKVAVLVTCLHAATGRAQRVGHGGVGLLPCFGGDDGFVLSGISVALEAHAPGVDGIFDQMAQPVALDGFTADRHAVATAALEDALARADAFLGETVGDVGERAESGRFCIDTLHDGCFLRVR